ncbi:uncharacterized protein LOC103374397 [Stegastes partitus]|uniref:Uncharacterized LOC103374397 n=1 Tax=Stegastes partitus TaxID=144197 RepID=A0A3B5B3U9_9TELE|nr:PREDICTED: uncharacterized protein LOC103374397 [Stegastes partitus]
MWPPLTSTSWPGCLCLFAAALAAASETTVYGKLGGEVELRPNAGSGTIKSVLWKSGSDMAIEWYGAEVDSYRQFKERGHLNTSTGVMTITGLLLNDSGVYTPEINNVEGSTVRLVVMSAVPVPTVSLSCEEGKIRCTLSCDGHGTEPVTYAWTADDTVVTNSVTKEFIIDKEISANIKEFSCVLSNAVSHETSQPISNPFDTDAPTEEGQLKISAGVTVFICLLVAVLLLGVVHRLKAGMWFFEKASMPWEADFWRKQERSARDAAESNGTTHSDQKGQSDEETPMA